jgi:hypothetical protein
MKKIILLAVLLLSLNLPTFSQNNIRHEIYSGVDFSLSEDKAIGYNIGLNFIYNMIQAKKPHGRNFRMLIGFQHSGLQASKSYTFEHMAEQLEDCDNCELTKIGGSYNERYALNRYVRGVSLNLGVEVAKNLFVISGVTQYQNITKFNKETISDYRTTYIDGGLKYFINGSRTSFSPTVKFNAQVISLSMGFAF